MKVTLWGTRGSVASPGSDTVRYGGDTSCVEVRAEDGSLLVLDAGTGARRLGGAVRESGRVDLMLTHLHMDHIQGLGFFGPLYQPDLEVHIWGPVSTTKNLRERLSRYLSPPLFPVRLRDFPCKLEIHDVTPGSYRVGAFQVTADLVCHPGPTLGYRVEEGGCSLAYIPDHEPALGVRRFPQEDIWTSGFELMRGADLLIHDAQYTEEQYSTRVGWGHSTMSHALTVARMAGVRQLVTFHHEPANSDVLLDGLADEVQQREALPFELTPGTEGAVFDLSCARPGV